MGDDEYLNCLHEAYVPSVLQFRPDLIVYVSGADPFYYWLPALEERWQTDPMARLLQDTASTTCSKSGGAALAPTTHQQQ